MDSQCKIHQRGCCGGYFLFLNNDKYASRLTIDSWRFVMKCGGWEKVEITCTNTF
jgi:hypothetical protein